MKNYLPAFTTSKWLPILWLALAYALLGRWSLLFALPPGFATAIFPSAGLAMALCTRNLRNILGIALGSFLLNFTQSYEQHGLQWICLFTALTVAFGSSVQTAAGAYYLSRWTQASMDSGRDILHFLFGMPFICLLSASISVFGLTLLGVMPREQFEINWLAWWAGDLTGVVLFGPIVWIFFGQPRPLWWQRRYMLGIPMILGVMLSAFIYGKTSIWEKEQQMVSFHLQAQQIGDLLQARFNEHERFLHIAAAMFDDDDHFMSIEDFNNLAATHLDSHAEVSALSWAQPIAEVQRKEVEASLRQRSIHEFDILQRGKDALEIAPTRDKYLPITMVTPYKDNMQLLGLDWLSEKDLRHTVETSLHKWQTVASPVVADHIGNGKSSHLFLTVFPNLNNLHGRDANQPLGLLSLTIQMESYLQYALKSRQFDDYLVLFQDITDVPVTLYDNIHAKKPAQHQRQIRFGGRTYLLSIAASQAYMDKHIGWESWIVLTFCMFVTSVLGCMMLVVSGDKARIYALVNERTSDLREREARLQAILDHAADAILSIDHTGKIVSANNATSELFGLIGNGEHYLAQYLVYEGQFDINKVHQEYQACQGNDLILKGRNEHGHSFPLALAISKVEMGDHGFYVCILRDLTELQRSQEKIHHLAHHDPLTGLANRITLDLRLEQLLAISRRNRVNAAVMFIDIDHFKKINDSQGHQIGDLFLREVAKRLQESVRDADTIARFGGDEFIVVLAEQDSADHVTVVANRIVRALGMPYMLAGLSMHSGASIGIAMFPTDGEDVKALLRNADTAMYAAKSEGRGNFQFFSPSMNAATHERLLLENRLWEALEQQEFELFLQPQIDLQSRKLVGAEALIRWRHPDRGLVPPDQFIPVAEDSNLMQPLGEWVLERGIQILAGWKNGPLSNLRLALNLSARQCQIGSLLPLLDRLISQSGVAVSTLELEITESAAMSDPEQTRELLRELRKRGIQVAIDDFGTGYSSLSYLKLFAIDRIKIDRSFVKDIETDPNDAVIVTATIALAHSLGLEVIAEGVESSVQCQFLRNQQCDEAQGYYFSRPLPLDDFVAFAQNYQQKVSNEQQA